jgi:hypothetical protein
MDKLAEGEIDLDIDWGIDFNVLPKNTRKAYDAIMGEDGLIACIKTVISTCGDLPGQFADVQGAIDELPKDGPSIKDALTEAGLSGMAIVKTPAKITGNIKQFASAPGILTGLLSTVKSIVGDLQQGLSGAAADSQV